MRERPDFLVTLANTNMSASYQSLDALHVEGRAV